MTFQLGDKVRFKKVMRDWEHWQSDMDDLLGKTGTVSSTYHQNEDIPSIKVDGDLENYWYPTECLERVVEFKLGDKVNIVRKSDWHGWADGMDSYIGTVGVVENIKTSEEEDDDFYHGQYIQLSGGGSYWYPDDALTLLSDDAPQKLTINEPLQDYERF